MHIVKLTCVCVLQMSFFRAWQKTEQTETDHLLHDLDSDDNLPDINNSFGSDNAPGTPNSFDFNTDVEHGSTDSTIKLK